MSAEARRGASAAAAFAVLTALPFLAKAWNIDEPLYLPVALQILKDPLHPYAFDFNWYGTALPYPAINNTPPLLHYLLAGALALTGGSEAWTRLLFLPFDAAAAAALYLLGARFLKRPLLPTLLILAGPCYLVNMGNLMAEKLVAAFGFWAALLAARYADERRERLFYGSAALLSLAFLSKYLAALFLPAIALQWLACRVDARRLAGYCLLALAPLGLYLLWQSSAVGAAALVTRQSWALPTAGWAHKLRALSSFTGAAAGAAGVWAAVGARRRGPLLSALVFVLLFAPALDLAPLVRPVDRGLGFLLAALGLWALWVGAPRRPLWAGWTAGALVVLVSYWSVMARLALFLAPPLVFGCAEALESSEGGRRRPLMLASVAVTLVLSWALSWVDARHGGGSRDAARLAAGLAAEGGGRVWSAGHWGLQWYVEKEGGKALDASRGGWDEARPGDVVVVPTVNSNVMKPRRPVTSDVVGLRIDSAVPLRLLSAREGEGGFYSSVFGFLPFSLSREPVDELSLVRLR